MHLFRITNHFVVFDHKGCMELDSFSFEEGVMMLRNQTEAWFTDRTSFHHLSHAKKKQNVMTMDE